MNAHLNRLLKAPRLMTVKEAAEVVGMSRFFIEHLIKQNELGHECLHGRSEEGAKRKRDTYRVPRTAMIRYIVKMCRGDERDELLREIEQHAPTWLEMAKRAAARADEATEPHTNPKIIPIFGQPLPSRKKASSSQNAAFADMPDLFGGAA